MNEEIINQLKEILNKYPDRQLEILLYVFGRDNLMRIVNEPTYEQLQQENKQLKEELKYTVPIVEHNKIVSKKLKEIRQLKEEKEELKKYLEDDRSSVNGEIASKLILNKIKELEEGE